MSKLVKFSAQMNKDLFQNIRLHAKESGQKLTAIFNEMAATYLKSRRVRPEVMKATETVLREDRELLERLAK
jgi:hypothetical protein